MPKASQLSFLGIAKEATVGTAVAPTAFIPVQPPSGKDNITLLQDKGLRGALVDVYDDIAGPKSGTYEFDGDVIPDTFGWLAAAILGDIATTGASAPFTHTVSTLNSGSGQPKSYTLTDFYSAATRAYPGAMFNELDIKFSADGMLTYSAKATTFGSGTATKPTASFTAVTPLASWIGSVTLAAAPTAVCLDGEINIKRDASIINAVDGTQNPAQIWLGPVSVSGKLTLVMEDDTVLTQYLSTGSTTLTVNFAQGTGTSAVQVQAVMSKVKLSGADIDRGKDYVTLSVAFDALANSTDIGTSGGYSPIKLTIQNAITTGTYA
jgi:hypothetical protein